MGDVWDSLSADIAEAADEPVAGVPTHEPRFVEQGTSPSWTSSQEIEVAVDSRLVMIFAIKHERLSKRVRKILRNRRTFSTRLQRLGRSSRRRYSLRLFVRHARLTSGGAAEASKLGELVSQLWSSVGISRGDPDARLDDFG